jgi:CRISPR-associated endonuclease/helicase Cas3
MDGKVFSHPGKFFEDHISEIIRIGGKLIEVFGPDNKEKKEKYHKILRYVALFHDLGKLTDENQQKIKNSEKLAHEHSKYGEVIFNIFWKFLEKELKNSDINEIVSFIIRHHHTYFKNFIDKDEKLLNLDERDKERIEEIISKIHVILENLKDFFTVEEINQILSLEKIDMNSALAQIKKNEDSRLELLKYIRGLETFIDVIFVASIFFIADRASASGIYLIEIENEINKILNPQIFSKLLRKFEVYVKEKLKTKNEIDYYRKEYYEKSIDTFKVKFSDTTRVYKIFLPTGIGKTYIGLRVALEISNKYKIPIVYALPFINIIDQIYDRLSEIFNNENTEIVSKLHHISVIEGNDGRSPFGDVINFELSPILITTFVQVFHSLFATERDFLLRLPLLLNSCIIVDEVQALDPEKFYYPLEELVKTLCNMGFKIRIIIMSATMPPIFSQNNKDNFAVEITSEFRNECYKLFNRYRIKIINKEIELKDYQNKLLNKVFGEYKDKHSIGIICNKVEEAKKIFETFKDFLGDGENFIDDSIIIHFEENLTEKIEKLKNISNSLESGIKSIEELKNSIFYTIREINCIGYYSKKYKTLLIYLAANLVDASKMNRIKILDKIMEEIKNNNFSFPVKIKEKEINRLIVISTQVIEAGVDFDFEVMFRSFAPFESIIQSAGRVNRNNKWKERGEVEVYKVIMNNNLTSYPIYPKFLIEKTTKLFNKNLSKENQESVVELSEEQVLDLAENYLKSFIYIQNEDFINYLKFMKFEEISKNFRVVDSVIGTLRLILDLSEISNKIEKLRELIKDKDYKKKRYIYQKIISYVYLLQAKVYLKKEGLNKLLELARGGNVKIYCTSSVFKKDKILYIEDLMSVSQLFVTEKSIYDKLTGFNFVSEDITYIL